MSLFARTYMLPLLTLKDSIKKVYWFLRFLFGNIRSFKIFPCWSIVNLFSMKRNFNVDCITTKHGHCALLGGMVEEYIALFQIFGLLIFLIKSIISNFSFNFALSERKTRKTHNIWKGCLFLLCRTDYGPNALFNLLYYSVARLSTEFDVQLVRSATL